MKWLNSQYTLSECDARESFQRSTWIREWGWSSQEERYHPQLLDSLARIIAWYESATHRRLLPNLQRLELTYGPHGSRQPFGVELIALVVGPVIETISVTSFGGEWPGVCAATMLKAMSSAGFQSRRVIANIGGPIDRDLTEYFSGLKSPTMVTLHQQHTPITRTLLSLLCRQPLQSLLLLGPPSQDSLSEFGNEDSQPNNKCPTLHLAMIPQYVFFALLSLPGCPLEGCLEILHITVAALDPISVIDNVQTLFRAIGGCKRLKTLWVTSPERPGFYQDFDEDENIVERFNLPKPHCPIAQLLRLRNLESLTISLDGRLVRPPCDKDFATIPILWPKLVELNWNCHGAPNELGSKLPYKLPTMSAISHLSGCLYLRQLCIPIEVRNAWAFPKAAYREDFVLHIDGWDSLLHRRSFKSLEAFLGSLRPIRSTVGDWITWRVAPQQAWWEFRARTGVASGD